MITSEAQVRVDAIAEGSLSTNVFGHSLATVDDVRQAIILALSDPTIMDWAAHEQGLI